MSSFSLKIIAILTMLVDHIGYFLFPYTYSYRIVGRIAFPIFAFMVPNAMRYSSDKKKYLTYLLGFATLYQIPSIYFRYGPNIFFTLFLGGLLIYIYEKKDSKENFYLSFPLIIMLSDSLGLEYGSYGILMIFLFHLTFEKKALMLFSFIALNLSYYYVGLRFDVLRIHYIQLFSMMSMAFILLYNKKRGLRLKYFFYVFYPLHLGLLYVIKHFYWN